MALITDDPVQDSRLFMRSGGLAIRGGLPPDVALQAMTLTPARLMHIDDEVGSLDVGKNADFVLLTDTPFSTWSLVQETWIEGNMVFDRADPAQALYATGGDLSSRGLR